MIPSVIEREILIEAPVQTVWGVVTEPAQISRWFSDAAKIDLRPGGEGTLTFEMRATNERATVRLLIETAEPPHTFATAHEGNSTRVEFTLTAEGENTRLRVTESGFPKLERPEEEKAAYADVHGKGWDIHLANLRDYVSGQS
jgi:uncharacterized protein YndB with AHSA1/START domain